MSPLPPPGTFAEGQRLVYGILASAAGVFCGACAVGTVALLMWGGWSPAEEHTIVTIFGWSLGGFILAMIAVIIGLLAGGPVGEQAAHRQTELNHRRAADAARAADRANAERVRVEQAAIDERTAHDLQARLLAARALAERLRPSSSSCSPFRRWPRRASARRSRARRRTWSSRHARPTS